MGNIDSRSQHDWGYLYIKTDEPTYPPGGTVTGKIFIRTSTGLNAKNLELEI